MSNLSQAKRCSKCGETKSRDAFGLRSKNKDGLRSRCHECERRYAKAKRDAGICASCARPVVPGLGRCEIHISSHRARKRTLKASGLCIQCREPSGGYDLCEKHRKQKREKAAAVRASGLCNTCRQPVTIGFRWCRKCWLKSRAYAWLGSRDAWVRLEEMWVKRGGLCALTGIELTQGTASLDHVVHRGNGGKGTISNLRWTHLIANKMRGDMTDAELVSWCRRILNHATGKSKKSASPRQLRLIK